jgi:hypothetical protein
MFRSAFKVRLFFFLTICSTAGFAQMAGVNLPAKYKRDGVDVIFHSP